jgi:hypothetical protein
MSSNAYNRRHKASTNLLRFVTFRRQSPMPKTSSISIHLEPEQFAEVQKLAKKFGTNDVQIIRWAIDALREYVALHNGKLHMPIAFDEFWQLIKKTVPQKVEPKVLEPSPRKGSA